MKFCSWLCGRKEMEQKRREGGFNTVAFILFNLPVGDNVVWSKRGLKEFFSRVKPDAINQRRDLDLCFNPQKPTSKSHLTVKRIMSTFNY